MAAESQDNSSNEGSSTNGSKLLKSMTSLLTSLRKNMATLGSNMIKILKTQKEDKKDFAEHVKILNELNKTQKKNTYETHNQLVEIQGSMRRTDAKRLEYADSTARKFLAQENAKPGAEKKETHITQGEPSRRSDGVSTDTRSKRLSIGDENPRPTKRGGGRSSGRDRGRRSGSDRGGRTSGGDRGRRSGGSGRGGRALPPF
ncbi:polyribonucleotide nucleotidyltransferase-like [Impatiens glandulifera]|uniref:polyribonucleotide nucleotidyltransferase-like n=1 Tax=Impatiens glandulifera TaxID=253017 RepID=UPI001FB0BC7D|nr:polyribonucleotide nucleotidyltransferase-like [Impatiens glandulifera]